MCEFDEEISIITFDSDVEQVLKREKLKTLDLNKIPTLKARGATNFKIAFEKAIDIVRITPDNLDAVLIFMTDG